MSSGTEPGDAQAIHRRDRAGTLSIRREDGLLWIAVEGEIECRAVYEAVRDGFASGLIALSMPTLVDMRRYTGSIDWVEIARIATIAPWGNARVAYVSEARLFGNIVKVVSSLFRRSRHQHFAELDIALSWLQEPAAA